MRQGLLAISIFALALPACSGSSRARGPNNGGTNPDGSVGPGSMNIPNCDPTNAPADGDQDHDGYTPAMGDCNDCNPSINPGAIQLPNDPTDYACNGMPGVVSACDSMNVGKNDPTSLAQAFEQCDSRFFKSAMLVGPSDPKARAVTPTFGSIKPLQGANMALLSTGLAVDKTGPGFVEPQIGTNLGCSNTYTNPLPSIPPSIQCASQLGTTSCQPPTVNDYTELVLKLHAPTNVNSFSFEFQFFSAEYPDFVCTQYNDEFLVLQESSGEFATPTNISFDMNKNPITVNNGLFSVCQNGTQAYDKGCKQPVTMLAGTGYEDPVSMAYQGDPNDPLSGVCSGDGGGGASCGSGGTGDTGGGSTTPIGGSTGWLTTTAPVTPGEDVTLHFIIFDEGDHIYDSAALIDNFRWGTSVVSTPSTTPIQ
jgi:hypothetical protein